MLHGAAAPARNRVEAAAHMTASAAPTGRSRYGLGGLLQDCENGSRRRPRHRQGRKRLQGGSRSTMTCCAHPAP